MDCSKIVSNVKNSIAKIIAFNTSTNKISWSGSGFVFRENGLVVTCNHVVEEENFLYIIKFPNSNKNIIYGKVVIRDVEHDLALLKIDNEDQKPLKENDDVKEGMEVIFAGYPLSMDDLVTHQGILSSIVDDATNIRTYLIDGTVNPGNSGCPLLNTSGEVIGIVNAQRRESKEIIDKVSEMRSGAISIHNVDLVDIYKALISNLQLGIGYAVPVSYVPNYKVVKIKTINKKPVVIKKTKI